MPLFMADLLSDPWLLIAALAQLFLVLWGALVSLREDWAKRHRWLVLSAFAVLGFIGLVATAKQAGESAAANAKLAGSLDKLGTSTQEISRMTVLNTELQQRLLDSSKTVASLARENINAVTGGRSYPIITPITALPVKDQNTLALQAFVVGENTLMDVQYRIIEGKPPYIPTADDLKGEMTGIKRRFVFVGPLPPHRGEFLPTQITPSLSGVSFYTINLMSRNRFVNEQLQVRLNEKLGRWEYTFRIQDEHGKTIKSEPWPKP
jgi:hypothetical protein